MIGTRIAFLGVAVLALALATSLRLAASVLCAVLALAVLVQLARAAQRVWRLWTAARFSYASALIERSGKNLPPDASRMTVHFARWLGVADLHMEDTR